MREALTLAELSQGTFADTEAALCHVPGCGPGHGEWRGLLAARSQTLPSVCGRRGPAGRGPHWSRCKAREGPDRGHPRAPALVPGRELPRL